MLTMNGRPPMVDEQAIIMFLCQLDHALSAALHADEQQRLRLPGHRRSATIRHDQVCD